MGRFTEYQYLINIKPLPPRGECLALCPSLGDNDLDLIVEIRRDNRKNIAKEKQKD